MRKVWVSVDLEPDISEYLVGSQRGLFEGLPRLLAVLEDHSVPIDVFVLGEVAKQHPDLVREVARRAQNVGSHGYRHELLCARSGSDQCAIVRRSIERVVEATGRDVRMFRAPNFSADGRTVRALEAADVRWDSSVLPGRKKTRARVLRVYDHRRAPRMPYHPSHDDIDAKGGSSILEFPVTENPLQLGTPIGLGFLNSRSLPATVRAVESSDGPYAAFLIHPWEATDLPVRDHRLPTWLSMACSPDVTRLREFLDVALARWGFTTAADIATAWRDAA